MQTLLHDLRYAVRTLCRQPVFSLVALLTLALGIGANTAIFSLIDSVLLRPLPYPHAERLISVWGSDLARGKNYDRLPLSVPRYEVIRDQQTVFEDLGVSVGDGFTLTGRGEPTQLNGCWVSSGLLPTLGLPPLQGRLFLPEEDRPGGPRVAILSEACWRKHFAGDPGIVGQNITLNQASYTVVGILSKGYVKPYDFYDVYAPNVLNTGQFPANVVQNGGAILYFNARLKPGVSLARADQELKLLAERYRQVYPNHVDAAATLQAMPHHERVVGRTRPMFYTLAGAVGCVLVIACVNVANLLLARLEGRRREIAIRAALGAGRWRLARQFLTESLLLTLAAGVLGTLLALWCVDLARHLERDLMPRAEEIHLNGEALLFTLFVSILVGVLLGVAPALHAALSNTGAALQQAGTRGSAGGVRQGRTRSALLVAQVALSLVLLMGTGLLLTSLWQLQRVKLGFNPIGMLRTNLTLPPARYATTEQQTAFFTRLTERLDALPGVARSTVASAGLLESWEDMFYAVVGQPVPPVKERPSAKFSYVGRNYFGTVETPLLRGRLFAESDRVGAPLVVIINEAMAKKVFPNGDALGQKLLCTAVNPTVTEIVGVVADARTSGLAEAAEPELYFSVLQRVNPFTFVYVRAARPEQAKGLALAIRGAVRALDADQPIDDVLEMNTVITRDVADRQLIALLLASFAGLALVLAAIGIYGVTAYGVAQRTREIGIRMALGAQRSDVFRLIVGGGMKLVLAGIVVGVVSALGLTRLLVSLLYGVGTGDPLTFAAVVGMLTLVALLANYLPARRAMRVDPLTALRED